MVLIEEEQSFSLTANVLAPGYMSVAPKGYIVSRRADGIYAAPLIPQLFYGASGTQLQTWRQWIPSAGSQVILSKPAGELLVPKEELYWRKVAEAPVVEPVVEEPKKVGFQDPKVLVATFILGVLSSLVAGYVIAKAIKQK